MRVTLGQAQRRFTLAVGKLILRAYELGYELSLGDAYRDPRVFGMIGQARGYGRARSNHKRRLAVDLNLFREGVYLDASEDHRELGEWWESYGLEIDLPLSWGGHFGDGNHYSMQWRGQR